MGHQRQDDCVNLIISGLIFIACWYRPCSGIYQDDICGNSNGRRLYLELGEHGILTATNVSLNANSHQQHSPSSGNLSSHEQCSLELVTCPACVVSVTFHHLDLPHHCGGGNMLMDSPCHCDYVWLSEPPYEDVSGVPFCGFLTSLSSKGNTPLKYQSQTRSLAITLLYSEAYKHAFTLEYTAERNRQEIKGSPGSNVAVSPSANMSHSGILTSPHFPAQYPRDLGIEYVITCQTDNNSTCRVRVVFRDFQLSTVSIMEFYDWNGQRLEVSSGALFRPPVILTTGPSLLIRFYANGGAGLGFKAVYSFINENIQESSIIPITDCGGYVENMGGAITMMNMVEQGIKTYDCVWLIRPPKNYLHLRTHIYLKVATFRDMAGITELQVIQGLTSEHPVLDTLRYPAAHIQVSRHREHVAPVNVGFYVSLRGTFGPLSRLAIVYTAFSYMDCFPGPDFLCQNHRCIPSQLSCDGFDHCGDNSDEPNTCYQEWETEPHDRHWYSHTPNYYFPKMERYPDLKTATLVFVVSSLGLILLITALILLLYRMGSRARQQREIQNRLQTISELLDGARMDESSPPDDPPVYEAPPDYDEVIKVFLEPVASQRQKKKKCHLSRRSTRRIRPSSHNVGQSGEGSVGSEQCRTHPASILEVALPNPVMSSAPVLLNLTNGISPAVHNITSRSCQTTPIPDSPPPPYTDTVVSIGPTPQLLSPENLSEPSTSADKLSKQGSKLRQSWLLFRQESTEDQLLSVVVTGIGHPSNFQENEGTFRQIPETNILAPITESTEATQHLQQLMVSENITRQQNTNSEMSTLSSVVPVNRSAESQSLLQPPENNFMDKQCSSSTEMGSDFIYRGRIIEVKRIPRSLFSFDDLIPERLSKNCSQFRQIEVSKPNSLIHRRCASHNSICQMIESKTDSQADTYENRIQHSELKFRSHPQIPSDFNLILDMGNKKMQEIPGSKVNNSNQNFVSNCSCEGACGCATSQPKPTQRRKHHVRSMSAGYPSLLSSDRSKNLRELDIYFSLHEFGSGDIGPLSSLTCDNNADIEDEKEPVSPHKLWEIPDGNTAPGTLDNNQCIL